MIDEIDESQVRADIEFAFRCVIAGKRKPKRTLIGRILGQHKEHYAYEEIRAAIDCCAANYSLSECESKIEFFVWPHFPEDTATRMASAFNLETPREPLLVAFHVEDESSAWGSFVITPTLFMWKDGFFGEQDGTIRQIALRDIGEVEDGSHFGLRIGDVDVKIVGDWCYSLPVAFGDYDFGVSDLIKTCVESAASAVRSNPAP